MCATVHHLEGMIDGLNVPPETAGSIRDDIGKLCVAIDTLILQNADRFSHCPVVLAGNSYERGVEHARRPQGDMNKVFELFGRYQGVMDAYLASSDNSEWVKHRLTSEFSKIPEHFMAESMKYGIPADTDQMIKNKGTSYDIGYDDMTKYLVLTEKDRICLEIDHLREQLDKTCKLDPFNKTMIDCIKRRITELEDELDD